MDTHNKHEESGLTLLEVVETLSSIADMEIDTIMDLVNHPEMIDDREKKLQRVVQWLKPGDMGATVESAKETFRTILNYLRNFYKKEYHYSGKPEAAEGIKTIMLLVGEAAKKLDRYTELFHNRKSKSVTELKEYKKLQEFYLSRIAHKVDDDMIGKWLIGLTKRMMAAKVPVTLESKQADLAKHVFVDLDAVKKDTEYELFFIRKEDGTRFFSPRLIRNIKLVCDFGESLTVAKSDDQLESVNLWHDQTDSSIAHQILKQVNPLINDFYKTKALASELRSNLSKALMALMICAEPHTVIHDPAIKCCKDYLKDFFGFLRAALHTREYQRSLAYPAKAPEAASRLLLEFANGLCHALFTQVHLNEDGFRHIVNLVHEASHETSPEHQEAADLSHSIWNRLACDNAALTRLMKQHAHGPLLKVLSILEDGSYNAFDPLWQDNLPYQLFDIHMNSQKVTNIHLPSPTYQEFINKAHVIEEFKGFLRSMENQEEHHLMINFQDRTSWKEHARSVVLEDLQRHSDFSHQITVVTLAKDTEFYLQLAPYNAENHAHVFIENFLQQLSDSNSGYFFPDKLHKVLFPDFITGVMRNIHKVFFSGKNVLTRDQRLDFIEIFYCFLQLKLIELVKPTTLSLTCKDGVDVSASANAELYVFLRLLNQEAWTQHDFDELTFILYGNAIMTRERILVPDRFVRLQNMIRKIEQVRNEYGSAKFMRLIHETFGHFFKDHALKASVSFTDKDGKWFKVA